MNKSKTVQFFCSVALMGLLVACAEPIEELGPVVTLAVAESGNPTLAGDPTTGATYAAWVVGERHEANVWISSLSQDGTRSEPVRVNDIPGDAAPHTQAPSQVAVGPRGNVYVLWTNNTPVEGKRFPASNLRFARSVDGGKTFEPALTVNDDVGGVPTSHTFHNLIVASDGTIVASWIDGRRDPSLGGPAEGGVIQPDDNKGDRPKVPGPDIRVAISNDGGRSFLPSSVVDMQACPCCRTSMAFAPDGTLFLAWRKIYEGDIRDIAVARSADFGRTWDEPVRVSTDDWVFPGCPHAGPVLTVDSGGTLHVGWYTGEPSAPGLYYARSDDLGRTFSPRETLLVDTWVPPSQVALTSDDNGFLWVAWEDRRFEQPVISYLVGKAGEPLQVEDAELQPGTNPVLSTSRGRTVMAWLNGDKVELRAQPGQ